MFFFNKQIKLIPEIDTDFSGLNKTDELDFSPRENPGNDSKNLENLPRSSKIPVEYVAENVEVFSDTSGSSLEKVTVL